MKKFMVYTIKGGEGKTTHSKTIARGFAEEGKRVLLVDIDPQGNSSKSLLSNPNNIEDVTKASEIEGIGYIEKKNTFVKLYSTQSGGNSTSDVFLNPNLVKDCIHHSKFENLDVLPSNLSLANVDTLLRLETNKRTTNRLSKALRLVNNDYDVAIIDCPPTKSLLTVNAMMCNPTVLIPVAFSEDALQGVALTIREIDDLKDEYDELENVDFRILLTMKNSRQKAHKQMEEMLRAYFGDRVLKTTIRNQESPLNKANALGSTVLDLHKTNIRSDYEELMKELANL